MRQYGCEQYKNPREDEKKSLLIIEKISNEKKTSYYNY